MRKFKGFTLIELIVVLATFSIIMFGALSLMTPVSKMMVQADVHEGANAAASNIARYLEQELSGAEYLYVGNGLLDDMDSRVAEYVQDYYEGVLRAGSTPDSQQYASGYIHVLTIDNTKDAKISRYTYYYDEFNINCTFTSKSDVPYAINKAYYDDYDFEIQAGTYDDLTTFDDAKIDSTSLPSYTSNGSVAFTIKTTANGNHTDYHFLTSTAFPLVNLVNRSGAYPSGCYYVITQKEVTKNEVTEVESSIIDMGDKTAQRQTYNNTAHNFQLCRNRWSDHSINVISDGERKDGYWFIYSYGSEINTKKTATS